MATEASGDLRCGIGARLRSARERSGMSILQAAEKLHADPRVLEALEAERFEELGAAVFVRGHIRRYAELVREQPQELHDLYAASAHAVARPDLTRIPKTTNRSTDPRTLVVPGLVFVIAVGLIGLVWWFLTSLRSPGAPSASTNENSGGVITEPGQPSAVVPDDAQPAAPPDNAGVRARSASNVAPRRSSNNAAPNRGSESGRTASVRSSGPAVPAPESRPVEEAEAPSLDATAPDPVVASTTPTPESAPVVVGGKPAEVTLRFSGDSWAEVYDANGTRLFYDIGAADSVKTLSGTPPLRVILGNPGGVAVEVNGKAATVPQVAGSDNGIQFSVNRSGRVSRARAAPTGQ